MGYFAPYSHSKDKREVELDFFNHATKSDLKNVSIVDTSQLPEKDHLANLKSEVDKLDIDKSEKVSSGLNNLKSKVEKSGK